MATIFLSAVIGTFLFLLGYYIGNQLGKLEPIREHLRNVREGN